MDSLIIKKIKKEYYLRNPVLLKKFDTRGKRRAFLIADGKDKYVLKSLPNKKELKNRLDFLSKIKERGINIPTIITTKLNKKYFLYSHNAFFLSGFIDLKENRPSKYFFKNLGSAVGELHKIKKSNNKIPYLNILRRAKTTEKILLRNKMDDAMKNKIIEFFDSFPDISGLTEGLVHCDISYFNALGKGKIFLIDFDDVSFGPIAYDLGQMIAFMFNLIPFDFPKFGMKKKHLSEPVFLTNGFKFFLESYSKKIKLSSKDIKILPQMAMLACLENVYLKSINRIFKWNYKRFEKIEKKQNLIKKLTQKYF